VSGLAFLRAVVLQQFGDLVVSGLVIQLGEQVAGADLVVVSPSWAPLAVPDALAAWPASCHVLPSAHREGGDTKTAKSRRALEIPDDVTLKDHHAEQAKQKLKAGKSWQDNDLVFCTSVGTPLDAANVRRSFRRITKAAGVGENCTPRELRHSFVSIMRDN
jgi:hypothetical protein